MFNKRVSLQLVFALALLVAAAPTSRAEEAAVGYRTQLLDLHNAARAEQKLAPLTHDNLLAKAAQSHAEHMAATGKLGHEAIGDGTIDSRIDDAGYRWTSVAENIGWGAMQPPAMMRIWLESKPHRATLLGEYKEVGFGRAVAKDGKVYWVACFGVPLVNTH